MASVLALDLGTTCGFALLRADGKIESGHVSLAPKKGEGAGMRFLALNRWLIDTNATHELGRIAYEEVIGHGPGAQAGHIYGGLLAVVMMFAERHALPYRGHHVGTIKKAWTGNGAAKKPDMMERCRELGFAPGCDNEADAIALLHVELGRVPALPIARQTERFKRRPRPNPDTRTGAIPYEPF